MGKQRILFARALMSGRWEAAETCLSLLAPHTPDTKLYRAELLFRYSIVQIVWRILMLVYVWKMNNIKCMGQEVKMEKILNNKLIKIAEKSLQMLQRFAKILL